MATYRYMIGDLLTNTVDLELPLFGVFYSRRLNKAGNATFSYNLGNKSPNGTEIRDVDILNYTKPGRSCLWIERNGALIWGGIIWSRTYQSQANVMSYTAQTFESYFYAQVIEVVQRFTATDQRSILAALVTHMQAKPYANIGLIIPGAFTGTPITRSATFYSYNGWTYGKAIEFLINFADGFDYTIDVSYDVNNNKVKTLSIGNVLGQSIVNTQLAFDYPGNIKNYWYPESASNAATSILAYGAGDGASTRRTKYIMQDLLNDGYPDLQQTYDNKDVGNINTLIAKAKAIGDLIKVPIIVATFEINPEMEPTFGSWNIGDYAKIHVEDLRFPDGKDILARIVGYDASPTSSSGQEEVRLVMAKEE